MTERLSWPDQIERIKADARLAVALAYQRAAGALVADGRPVAAEFVRALAPADDLAEVQALREQYAKLLGHANKQEDRAEAAEAEVARLRAIIANYEVQEILNRTAQGDAE